ncbi:MAG: biopolymer transporter ExbD [Rhodobacteraceae bacterium]|nr:MAG: biopolymer transporter ExbD [Paracoccaceae bacterium]
MTLTRPPRARALISLVPMIDVMLILLVFFMVTSTYLNLDMIPAVRQQDQAQAPATESPSAATIMIRLGADGVPVIRGQVISDGDLETLLRQRLEQEPLTQVMVLPSGAAKTQGLITVLDVATRAGVVRLRVIRLQARP